MHQSYHQSILLIERLHRYFLEVVKAELDRRGIQDINNVQALILYNIGQDDLTVGELTARGYYLGSNVSYNVKKMVENAYLAQLPDAQISEVSLGELIERLTKLEQFWISRVNFPVGPVR